ncbi:MAG: DUF4271 domain-containing protein [Bacteroidales bacterium]|nr:DUF4271 domain-containing protein [Bacteroidales bacterium]
MQGQDTTMIAVFKGSGIENVSNVTAGGIEIMEKIQTYQPTWYFIYLFLLIGLLAWIRLYYGNILIQTVQASTNVQVANRMFKDNSLLQKQLDNVLYLFYFLSMAFLLYYIELRVDLRPYELQGGLLYLFNLALLAGIFSGRVLLLNIAGILFNHIRIFREYLYNIFIFNKLSGLAVLPLIFLLIYTRGTLQELFFWITIFVLSCITVMRLIRGVVFSYRKEVSVFYLFLYLCALEIAPLVLLYRWLEGIL